MPIPRPSAKFSTFVPLTKPKLGQTPNGHFCAQTEPSLTKITSFVIGGSTLIALKLKVCMVSMMLLVILVMTKHNMELRMKTNRNTTKLPVPDKKLIHLHLNKTTLLQTITELPLMMATVLPQMQAMALPPNQVTVLLPSTELLPTPLMARPPTLMPRLPSL